jgi:hypothetical protein
MKKTGCSITIIFGMLGISAHFRQFSVFCWVFIKLKYPFERIVSRTGCYEQPPRDGIDGCQDLRMMAAPSVKVALC